MEKYLITPSLLNSFQYYFKYEGEKEKEIRQDFIDTLHKDRFRMTPAMQRGIDFENLIEHFSNKTKTKICEKFTEKEIELAQKISQFTENGNWQVRVKKEIELNNTKFLLYGKCDVIKEDWIYDVKTTKSYDIGKYQDSAQHLLYMVCGGFIKFSYLIAQGGKELTEFYKEDYFYTKDSKQNLITKINAFLEYLENDKEAKELFYEKWKCKY